MREEQGGVFANGGYLVVAEDLAGAEIPAEEPLPLFEVKFLHGDLESPWFDLPRTVEDEARIVEFLGRDLCDDLDTVCRSSIPRLSGIVSAADELPELRLLSEALTGMSGEDIQKYKALLEVMKPETPTAALRLADEMPYYDVTLEYADPANYGLQHAAYTYSLEAD